MQQEPLPPPQPGASWSAPDSATAMPPPTTATSNAEPPPPRRNRRLALVAVVAALVLSIGAGVGWLLLRPSGEATVEPRDFWPTDPQLQGTFSLSFNPGSDIVDPVGPVVRGSVDDLFVIGPGETQSTVEHYVDGDLVWTVEVDGGVPVDNSAWIDDGFLVLTASAEPDSYVLTRLDRDSGATTWRIDLESLSKPTTLDGRLFASNANSIVEFNLDSGEPVNRLDAGRLVPLSDGLIGIDTDAATAQRYDSDFNPNGASVSIESSGLDTRPWIVTYADNRWIYYSNSRLVGLTDSGERAFECAASVEAPYDISYNDSGVLLLKSLEGAEAFTFNADSCTPTWNVSGELVYTVRNNLIVQKYRPDIDQVESQIFDIVSGESLAITTGDPIVSGDGYMVVTQEARATSIDLSSGEVQWIVTIPETGEVQMRGTMMIVTVALNEGATVQIYADD